MRLQIQHKKLGMKKSWAAKTVRGFNKKQLKEQAEFRKEITKRLANLNN